MWYTQALSRSERVKAGSLLPALATCTPAVVCQVAVLVQLVLCAVESVKVAVAAAGPVLPHRARRASTKPPPPTSTPPPGPSMPPRVPRRATSAPV